MSVGIGRIDRRGLVDRHTVVLRAPDVRSPLSVGNGEFCFTADITGLQTFPDEYPVVGRDGGREGTLLGTQAQWGWHSAPADAAYQLDDVMVEYETPRGPVPYVDMHGEIGAGGERAASEPERWMRANPHRLDLARLGLCVLDRAGRPLPVGSADVSGVHQELDLWRGMLRSDLRLLGDRVEVRTACHPRFDAVGVRLRSPALQEGRLVVQLAFPYGAQDWHNAADWTRPEAHHTRVELTSDGWMIARELDGTRYAVHVRAGSDARLERRGTHRLWLVSSGDELDVVVHFRPEVDPAGAGVGGSSLSESAPGSFADVATAAETHWARFWSSGGAVDLAGSSDERACELERRIVLSQYLTAINCAGSLPPQETGLVCNSWFGRFHLEMHWWHGAHFALWNRAELLERNVRWYLGAPRKAGQQMARRQGYAGVRWPKQVGPDARESPSPIGPFLIWQQPHPIYLAELLYRAEPGDRVLETYADVVFETAEFMASFPVETSRGFELCPPLVPAQESYAAIRTQVRNPTFELAYWHWALNVARRWRRRLGLDPHTQWGRVADGLVRPRQQAGRYAAIDVEPYTVRTDHPSMLCALGFVPETELIDPAVMRATLRDVVDAWDWTSTWGWDYPTMAMCAARLGEPELAVQALTMPVGKNEFLTSGHNWQTPSLPLYLPGNGGLLAAVALMAAGWDGSGGSHAPGFPDDGTWSVSWEGLVPAP